MTIFANLVLITVVFSQLASSLSHAQGPEIQSEMRDDLIVNTWIDPVVDVVVSQQVNLHIELATSQWFTGGTKIGSLEIEDAVVLRREKFAVNSTRVEDRKTWTVQLWTLTIYPQVAGEFIIPRIELDVPIADDKGLSVTRRIVTEPVSFSAETPKGLLSAPLAKKGSTWVASNHFEVDEVYDKKTAELNVGDAVVRTIELRSENLAAMMLPVLQFDSPSGLAIYQRPAKIVDKVNRGTYLASRTEVITYIVEEPGSYVLPAVDVFWWDLGKQSLENIKLGEKVVSTIGFGDEQQKGSSVKQVSKVMRSGRIYLGLWILLSVLCAVFGGLLWMRRRSNSPSTLRQKKAGLSHLRRSYIQRCRSGKFEEATGVFFQWFYAQIAQAQLPMIESQYDGKSIRAFLRSLNANQALKIFDQLMVLVHGHDSDQQMIREHSEKLSILESLPDEIEKALEQIGKQSKNSVNEFRLNRNS